MRMMIACNDAKKMTRYPPVTVHFLFLNDERSATPGGETEIVALFVLYVTT